MCIEVRAIPRIDGKKLNVLSRSCDLTSHENRRLAQPDSDFHKDSGRGRLFHGFGIQPFEITKTRNLPMKRRLDVNCAHLSHPMMKCDENRGFTPSSNSQFAEWAAI